MYNFNFNITKFKTKEVKTKHNKILDSKVTGVVNVEISGKFYIVVGNDLKYEIYPKNYSCKGKANVYPLQLDKKTKSRICYVRNENRQELIRTKYLPFAPGLCVEGNIIEENNLVYFDIKKVYLDNKVKGALDAFNFYKNNFKEIIKNIKKDK